MKGLENISATQIGTKARHLLAGESEAKVWGITSRGLFIHLESGWVIYLSPEEIPGPLTLNLESGNSLVDLASGGDMVRVSSQRIDFPRTKMHVNTAHAVPWEAPPPLEISIDLDKCRHRIMDVSRRAIELLNEAGRTPSALFQSYLALSGMGEPTRSSDGPWPPLLIDLVNARREESAGRVAVCLDHFPDEIKIVLGHKIDLIRCNE